MHLSGREWFLVASLVIISDRADTEDIATYTMSISLVINVVAHYDVSDTKLRSYT